MKSSRLCDARRRVNLSCSLRRFPHCASFLFNVSSHLDLCIFGAVHLCLVIRRHEKMRLASRSIVLLLCGSIFLRIPSDIRALATFSDIAGKYRLERGSMTMCRPSAVVRNQGNILPANRISFGGEDCRFDTVALRKVFGVPGLSSRRNLSVGVHVFARSSPWTCHGSTRRSAVLIFFRPTSTVDIIFPGFSSAFFYQKDILYFVFIALDQESGSCSYRFISAPTRRNNSTDSTHGKKSSAGGPSTWVWLGPIIGAVSTIAAALVLFFTCTRSNYVPFNFQAASSSSIL